MEYTIAIPPGLEYQSHHTGDLPIQSLALTPDVDSSLAALDMSPLAVLQTANHSYPNELANQCTILADLDLDAWQNPRVSIVEIGSPPASQMIAIGHSFAHVAVAFDLISPDRQTIVALCEIGIALPVADPNEHAVLAPCSNPNDVSSHISVGPFEIA